MFSDIFQNVLSTLICGAILCVLKQVYQFIKKSECSLDRPPKVVPKKTVQKQFFISLFLFAFSISGAWVSPYIILKIFLGLIAGYTFLFTWGAFDSALAFYPGNDPQDDKPADSITNESGDDNVNSH